MQPPATIMAVNPQPPWIQNTVAGISHREFDDLLQILELRLYTKTKLLVSHVMNYTTCRAFTLVCFCCLLAQHQAWQTLNRLGCQSKLYISHRIDTTTSHAFLHFLFCNNLASTNRGVLPTNFEYQTKLHISYVVSPTTSQTFLHCCVFRESLAHRQSRSTPDKLLMRSKAVHFSCIES